jgi:hypothetical protein
MNLPWKKNKPSNGQHPTSDQLTTELEDVKKAHAAAVAAVDEVNAKFIESGEDSDAQAVLEAKKQIQVIELHLDRSRKMLQAAKDREAEERRKAEKEAAERAQQAHAACLDEDEKLEDEEARLLLEVAKIRAKRWKVRSTARGFATKFVPHDHPERYHFLEVTRPPCDRILKTLAATCEGLGGLRGLINSMQISPDSYNHNQHHDVNVDWAELAEHPVKLKVCACRPKPQLPALPPPAPKVHEVLLPPMGGYVAIKGEELPKQPKPIVVMDQRVDLRMVGSERDAG